MDAKLESKMIALLNEYQFALKWTRDRLEEKEEECRKLRKIVLAMTGNGEEEGRGESVAYDP